MANRYFNLVGENLESTFQALSVAMVEAIGTNITIAPLRDDYIRKFGLWIRGEGKEVFQFISDLEKKLASENLNFDILEWDGSQERG
jgi:hypothetical protein